MKEAKKMMLVFSLLLLIGVNIFGCKEDKKPVAEKIKDNDVVESHDEIPGTVITLYVPGGRDDPNLRQERDRVFEEVSIRTAKTLGIQLKAKDIPAGSIYVEKNLENLFKTDGEFDAVVVTEGIENVIAGDYALDLTKLLPECAPGLYSQFTNGELEQVTYNGKLIGIPNLSKGSEKICVVAREDLLQKHDIKEIRDFNDYEVFLRKIKESEKLISPAPIANLNTAKFAQKYGYVMLDGYLVYRWDDPEMKLYAWEQTPEYREAYIWIRKLVDDGCIDTGKSSFEYIMSYVNSGTLASFVSEWDDAVRIVRSAGREYKWRLFPLDLETRAPRSPKTSAVIVINKNSKNPEKVLKLIEWIHSSQESYDLFMYGIEGRNYELEDGKVKVIKEHPYYGWSGSSAFENYRYSRAFVDDPPDLVELNRQVVEQYSEYPPTTGFIPSLNSTNIETINWRRYDFRNDANLKFTVKPKDYDEEVYSIIDTGKAFGADSLVDEMQKQLNEWLKSR